MSGLSNGKLLSFRQACDYLGVGERVMRKLLKTGEIPGIVVGRGWKIHRANVDAFVRTGGKGKAIRETGRLLDEIRLADELSRSFKAVKS